MNLNKNLERKNMNNKKIKQNPIKKMICMD